MDTKKTFKPNHPIVLGLAGVAASGKTTTARTIVPGYAIKQDGFFLWDHKYFAMPLYEMASIRRTIEGPMRKDRIEHELHQVLWDLNGRSPLYGLPPYNTFVELVKTIANLDIDMNQDNKPRSFLQQAGTLCREINQNCFVDWIDRSVKKTYAIETEDNSDLIYTCIVSDVRMPNEAKMIAEHPNGMVIKFNVSPEIQQERLMKRDNQLMTPEQANHESEKVDMIPKEYISVEIDTDYLTVQEQAEITTQTLLNELDIYAKN